jgi:uncharacterized RDD family membrane protein YckC
VVYAGFWRRFFALWLDFFVVGNLYELFALIGILPDMPQNPYSLQPTPAHGAVLLFLLIYYVGLEVSPVQATIGKRALDMAVTDLQGERITLARAAGRNLGKAISYIILLMGFVMAGFTQRKQALHDMLAGCLVIRR